MLENTLKTLSDRLVYALEITGTKKADLARAIGVQPQTIQHLCHGAVQSSRFTFELATVLRLNTHWLATGEGEIFLADDPKHQFFEEYKKIPLLDQGELIRLAKGHDLSELQNKEWAALKTKESNIFCAQMNDVSMMPMVQPNALLFFKILGKNVPKQVKHGEVVIAFLPSFDSLIIRQIVIDDRKTYLWPLNKNLFKEIELTNDIVIFGEAIECHFIINKK